MLVFMDGAAFQKLWIIYSCSFESKWPQPLLTLVTLNMHIYICLHMDVTLSSQICLNVGWFSKDFQGKALQNWAIVVEQHHCKRHM